MKTLRRPIDLPVSIYDKFESRDVDSHVNWTWQTGSRDHVIPRSRYSAPRDLLT